MAALEAGVQPDEDGIEDAFELQNEVAEHARGGESGSCSCSRTKPYSVDCAPMWLSALLCFWSFL